MRAAFARGCFFAGRAAIGLALCLAVTGVAGPATAAGYPDRTVKIIVPFPAGGSADVIPRIVAEWLSRKWGQPVVIENHAGAAGNIGAELVYRAEPDGYMLLSSPPPPLVVNQNLYPNLGFVPAKFEPIVVMAQIPSGLLVNPDKIKAASLAELIDYRNCPGWLAAWSAQLTVAGQGLLGA
jgi:tripartite-type tricarboxylate transporter receptor subunit TctC